MLISLRLSPVTVTETFSGAVSEIIVSSDNDPVESAHLQSSVFKLSKDLIDSIHEEGIVAYTS